MAAGRRMCSHPSCSAEAAYWDDRTSRGWCFLHKSERSPSYYEWVDSLNGPVRIKAVCDAKDCDAEDAARWRWLCATDPGLVCAIAYRVKAACEFSTPNEAVDVARRHRPR